MSMSEDKPKRKPGRPPWTEEQRQAFRETMERKRIEKGIEQRKNETAYDGAKRRKAGIKYREGKGGKWSNEMRESNAATWAKKRKEADEQKKALIAANPTKTKKELGIAHWKPADGSDSGYNAIYLRQARVSASLPPIDIRNAEQIETRIDEYFDFCEQNDKLPNLVGMSNWLGVRRETLDKWKRGDLSDDRTGVIQRAIASLEEMWVDLMQNNKINPANGIFLAKNLFQYRDQSDLSIRSADTSEVNVSADEIRKRYALNDAKTIESTFTDEEQKGDAD